jgi:hypothetical protein
MTSTIKTALIALTLVLPLGGGASSKEEAVDLRKVTGVYRIPVKIETVDDGSIAAEDILEIVQYSKASAYIRSRLHFYNGHVCNVWGIAEASGSSLVYRSQDDDNSSCQLTVTPDKNRIVLDDPTGNCRVTRCGARGGFSSASFSMSRRRNIKYMDRILQSSQYREAVEEYARLKANSNSEPSAKSNP